MAPKPVSTPSLPQCSLARPLARNRKHQAIDHQMRHMTHVVAILKLPQILRKKLPADMDMRAVDPELKLRPEALEVSQFEN